MSGFNHCMCVFVVVWLYNKSFNTETLVLAPLASHLVGLFNNPSMIWTSYVNYHLWTQVRGEVRGSNQLCPCSSPVAADQSENLEVCADFGKQTSERTPGSEAAECFLYHRLWLRAWARYSSSLMSVVQSCPLFFFFFWLSAAHYHLSKVLDWTTTPSPPPPPPPPPSIFIDQTRLWVLSW